MIITANDVSDNDLSLAIVVSDFGQDVTSALLDGALAEAKRQSLDVDAITIVHVPGAIEIPLVVKRLARSEKFQAIIALGAVIRGETSHFDYVCQQVSRGCQKMMLKYDCPVIFGVLTTENLAQAKARAGGEHSDKGKEAMQAALAMISIQDQMSDLLDD